ncbi:hypothetical protein PoB_001959000 [Plakobranchus ocellatus]|uniref:Uncharacterized protein n=1 Tax=Plakobranchus ocellatus TaxID=259542 RepID=A0AAV3ZES5_9GAST|nr:hypothetical protein PoB_001959000 [Plakobranchus ocellatus]
MKRRVRRNKSRYSNQQLHGGREGGSERWSGWEKVLQKERRKSEHGGSARPNFSWDCIIIDQCRPIWLISRRQTELDGPVNQTVGGEAGTQRQTGCKRQAAQTQGAARLEDT